jgi:hypothetical protein
VDDQRSFVEAMLDAPPLAPAIERAIAWHRKLTKTSG